MPHMHQPSGLMRAWWAFGGKPVVSVSNTRTFTGIFVEYVVILYNNFYL